MRINLKYFIIPTLGAVLLVVLSSCNYFSHFGTHQTRQAASGENAMYNDLTPEEKRVIINKGTERPFTGEYLNNHEAGLYTCKRCGAELYRSDDKFDSHCGWPSFDDEISGAIEKVPDPDGMRTEIMCANCGAHLGHVFYGEGITEKNTRHCVNSISLNFTPTGEDPPPVIAEEGASQEDTDVKTERAVFASGCFWGTEYYFREAGGVISTTVGFTGGHVARPSYQQVCTGTTGHAEAVEVIYDPEKTSFESLVKLYFETHDFTQVDRQGPDVGTQYRSEIFYLDEEQKSIAEGLIKILEDKGYKVATKLTPAGEYYPAEEYHQDYYEKNNKSPYCHVYRKIFD